MRLQLEPDQDADDIKLIRKTLGVRGRSIKIIATHNCSEGWERLAYLATCSKRSLLGAPGIAIRSKDATRGSWLCY